MTLDESPAVAAALGGKVPGHLITASDWNQVVEMLGLFGQTLIAQRSAVSDLEAAVEALEARVAPLEGLPETVSALEPLLDNYLVNISTSAADFLVGEMALITISVTALDGSLVTPAPWVDVFATWGRLRAAPGFNARANAEENALSVQVNAQGIAQVQLRSQYTKGFTATDETSFSTLLQSQVGATQQSIKQTFMLAATPEDAPVKAAMKTLHGAYSANTGTQRYLDGYVGAYTSGRFGFEGITRRRGEWEDYRTTVLAFAKPDADPVSPDPARGTASIQVNFREWVPVWADDFWGDLVELGPVFDGALQLEFDKDDIVGGAIGTLHTMNLGAGLIGGKRNTLAFEKAVAKVNPGADPVRQQAKALLGGAVKTQLNSGAAAGTEIALGYAAQAGASHAAVRQAQAATAQATQAQAVKAAVDTLEGRMKAAEETGRTINQSLTRIGDGVSSINVVEVADLGSRLQRINADLSTLAGRITR